eukprot:Skav211458  [mRNA]  locus=scaffold379:168349:173074:- [translate_table: standard]
MKTRLVKLHVTKRHDLWMKRFLAHKKWNLEKAVTAYLEMEEWRRKVRADEILQDYPDGKLNSVLPADMTGFYPYSVDKKGAQLRMQSMSWYGDSSGCVWRERAVVLVDLSHLDFNYFQGISSSTRARRRGTQQTTAQYYPGVVDKAYLLHAPSFASRAWNVLKFFLSEKLMEKAVLASSDEEIEEEDGGGEEEEEVVVVNGGDGEGDDGKEEDFMRICAKHQETLEVTAGASVTWQWALVSSSINFQVELPGGPQGVVGGAGIQDLLWMEILGGWNCGWEILW